MDKISFIQTLCTISTDADVNKKNYDISVNFANAVNVIYDILRTISDTHNLGFGLKIQPVDFSACTEGVIRVWWHISSRKKIQIPIAAPFVKDNCECVIVGNPEGSGYILTVKFKE
jgi:hypothetical protein